MTKSLSKTFQTTDTALQSHSQVCFKPATESGGEFLIADGERIFRDMDPDTLQTLVDRQVRISVSNLDLDVRAPPRTPRVWVHAKKCMQTLEDQQVRISV